MHAGIDRSLSRHVQQVLARLTSLFPLNFFGERVLDIPTYVVRATLYLFSKLVGRWLLSREESLPETDVFEVQLPVRLLGLSFELEAAGVDITPENLRREARVGVQYPNRT